MDDHKLSSYNICMTFTSTQRRRVLFNMLLTRNYIFLPQSLRKGEGLRDMFGIVIESVRVGTAGNC